MNLPIDRFKDAMDDLRVHGRKQYHEHALADMMHFQSVMSSQEQSVQHQLDTALAQQVRQNRECLISIMNVIVLCGKQNIALRGHRDDQRHLEQPGNHGNFHALLQFRIEAGDLALKNQLEHAARNARYT